jgi:hypothetical protein
MGELRLIEMYRNVRLRKAPKRAFKIPFSARWKGEEEKFSQTKIAVIKFNYYLACRMEKIVPD